MKNAVCIKMLHCSCSNKLLTDAVRMEIGINDSWRKGAVGNVWFREDPVSAQLLNVWLVWHWKLAAQRREQKGMVCTGA